MIVDVTIKGISMRNAQKICRYLKKEGITSSKQDIEIKEILY